MEPTFLPSHRSCFLSAPSITVGDKVRAENHAKKFAPRLFIAKNGTWSHAVAGLHLYLGKSLVLMELKIAIAFLACKFDFVVILVTEIGGLVLAMKGEFPIKATPWGEKAG